MRAALVRPAVRHGPDTAGNEARFAVSGREESRVVSGPGQLDRNGARFRQCARSGTPTSTGDDIRDGSDPNHEGERSEQREPDRGPQPDGGEHTEDRTCTARRACDDTDDGCILLLGAHDGSPNIDVTIGNASAGAWTSKPTPRVSTVIENRKN